MGSHLSWPTGGYMASCVRLFFASINQLIGYENPGVLSSGRGAGSLHADFFASFFAPSSMAAGPVSLRPAIAPPQWNASSLDAAPGCWQTSRAFMENRDLSTRQLSRLHHASRTHAPKSDQRSAPNPAIRPGTPEATLAPTQGGMRIAALPGDFGPFKHLDQLLSVYADKACVQADQFPLAGELNAGVITPAWTAAVLHLFWVDSSMVEQRPFKSGSRKIHVAPICPILPNALSAVVTRFDG